MLSIICTDFKKKYTELGDKKSTGDPHLQVDPLRRLSLLLQLLLLQALGRFPLLFLERRNLFVESVELFGIGIVAVFVAAGVGGFFSTVNFLAFLLLKKNHCLEIEHGTF